MAKSVEITCNACGADLTTTGNCVDYRLALVVERVPSGGGAVTSMMIYPPIERDAHFCGVPCLAEWLRVTSPDALEHYARRQKHRAWLAEQGYGP